MKQNTLEIMADAAVKALNTEVGQELVQKMLEKAIADGKTVSEWETMKQQLVYFLTLETIRNNKDLMHRLATEVYNELRA